MSKAVIVIAIVTTALAAANVTSPRRADAGPAGDARCGARDLGVTVGATRSGAGQRYATLILRNGSAHACQSYGYVGLRLLDRHGHGLPTNVVRVLHERARGLVLAAEGQAYAQLHWSTIAGAGEPAAGRCEQRPVAIEVTPPNDTRRLVAGWHGGPVCERGRIELTPLRVRR